MKYYLSTDEQHLLSPKSLGDKTEYVIGPVAHVINNSTVNFLLHMLPHVPINVTCPLQVGDCFQRAMLISFRLSTLMCRSE